MGRGGCVSRELGPSKGLVRQKDMGGSLGVEGGEIELCGSTGRFPRGGDAWAVP